MSKNEKNHNRNSENNCTPVCANHRDSDCPANGILRGFLLRIGITVPELIIMSMMGVVVLLYAPLLLLISAKDSGVFCNLL